MRPPCTSVFTEAPSALKLTNLSLNVIPVSNACFTQALNPSALVWSGVSTPKNVVEMKTVCS